MNIGFDLEEIFLTVLVFGVVCILGHRFVADTLNKLDKKNPFTFHDRTNDDRILKKITYPKKQTSVLGMVERVLYLLCFLSGFFAFVSIWLSLKTVVRWSKWGDIDGRIFFNNFLIGNGLNLIYTFLGYLAIDYIQSFSIFSPIKLSTLLWFLFLLLPYICTYIIQAYFLNNLPDPD